MLTNIVGECGLINFCHNLSVHLVENAEGTSSISSFFQDKDCHSLSSSGCDGFNNDHFPPSPSVNKICTRPVYHVQQVRPTCEGICDVHETSQQNKTFNIDARGASPRKKKRKELGSILRYFQVSDSSTKQVVDEFTQADAPFPTSGQTNTSISDSESYMEPDPSEHQRSNLVRNDNNDENNSTHVNETMQTSTAWHLNVEDVDPSVIDELPLEIQREVRGWLRLPKHVQATKRGSDITQYFLSAKK
ncbi:DNA polymerase eta-like [Dioscorea cayenensis subsp. rotundata]|uniref:DNA polymerase eta-like n=1 Tax=Dioscorea cayennensis subsp. rotundata TaxID=55577 RepID=A0AB40CJX6_DIOCR|nr:DNA polymerase eta-like [Dioscorea cayenensis subsp. rotundata]